jgi:CubicO group peptidase (beta-lactamase class C family)
MLSTVVCSAILLLISSAVAQTPPLVPSSQSRQPTVSRAVSAYATIFDSWVAKHHPDTAILVIRRGGTTVFIKGVGTDPNRPTLIGSLSKAITGACIASLVRDGRLSFQTTMREALPQFFESFGRPADQRFEDVTIEQLLVHRSGLSGSKDGDPIFKILRKRAQMGLGHLSAPQPLLVEHFKNRLLRDPGSEMSYSNSGYLTLTAVIEERSGRPYESYCRDHVLRGLSIDARLHPEWSIYSGSGGWMVAGADYLKFLDIFDPRHPFIGNDVQSWIERAQTRWDPDNRREWYSLGVGTSVKGDRRAVWHTGFLNSHGNDRHGSPITAVVASAAVRNYDGTGTFIAATPNTITDKTLRELREKLSRAYEPFELRP